MSETVLYRKYRPKKFSEIIGQSYVVQTLQTSLKKNNLSHAYIFSGTRGTGKTSIAKIFSKAINCLSLENGDCCNHCEACDFINHNNGIDIIELDAASNNGVDEIRTIIETANYLPIKLQKKVYIIDEAHMLTTSSWNALLKTVEEPPENVIFIFATTEFYKIPLTIVSRCQRYDFHKLNINELKSLINRVCDKEEIQISSDAIDKIAMLSDGAARDCLSILDQLAIFTDKNIDSKTINKVFGLVNLDKKIELINAIIKKNEPLILEFISDFKKNNLDALLLVTDLIKYILDKIIFLKTNDTSLIKTLTSNDLNKLAVSLKESFYLLDEFNLIYESLKSSSNPGLTLEIKLLKMLFNFASKQTTNSVSELKEEKKKIEETQLDIGNENVYSAFVKTNDLSLEAKLSQDVSDYSLDDVFKTETVTQKFEKQTEELPSVISSEKNKINDTEDFNHLVDENKEVLNPYLVKEKKIVPVIEQQLKQALDLNWKDIFYKIGLNNSRNESKKFNEQLEKIKQLTSFEDIESKVLANAEKALIVSQNGAILLFNSASEAKKFNDLYNNQKSYLKIKTLLFSNTPAKLLYGLEKKTAKQWKEDFKFYKQEHEDFKLPDVDLTILDAISPMTSSKIKEDCLKIFGLEDNKK